MKRHMLLLFSCIVFVLIAAAMNHVRFSQQFADRASSTTVGAHAETPTINLLLGGFRGIVADWLWVRAMVLQEQGRYVEIIQLADWITKLQPQFPDIWTWHAWNLAYNITVLLPDGEERWRWVYHGYKILRDNGIPATDFHPRVCSEIAWILMHKIAGTTDDFADTYFTEWVRLYAPFLDEAGRIPQDPDRQDAFVRESGIPKKIIEDLENRFGKHDWRHPLTHAAAWAYAGATLREEEPAARMAQHLFFQIYFGLFTHGTIDQNKKNQEMILRPDFDRLSGVLSGYTSENRLSRDPSITKQGLQRICQILVGYDRTNDAEKVYRILQDMYPNDFASNTQLKEWKVEPQTIAPRRINRRETP